MSTRCEDFPCCGHELGCCPDYDENGNQLDMKCTCGASVPLTSRYSICEGCMERMNQEENYYGRTPLSHPSEMLDPEANK
jgi:hypothetical protein